MDEDLKRLQLGVLHDPFSVLGWHETPKGWVLRTFMPAAEQVKIAGKLMTRVPDSDCFEITTLTYTPTQAHPKLEWQDKAEQQWHTTHCPYTFIPHIGELDLHLFNEGNHHQIWQVLGARVIERDGISGTQFAVWAPAVQRVSVVGDFNEWDGRRHPMRSRGESGVWELFIPLLESGASYKYEILTRSGALLRKTDPYAQQMFLRPETTSRVPSSEVHEWQDQEWIATRAQWDWQHKPVSIYEVHAGSWKRHPDQRFYSWRELADTLIPHAKGLGYTHLELLPISEHPLDESWGYQVSGYYAPSARFGSPNDFRYFVDQCHQHGLGVLLDWVPAHFPKDEFALARFNGEPLYEYADPRKGEHQDWGTLIFDYGRNEVKNFLIANALFWMEEFHIDGLRVDAVASMLYLDYSRNHGEWVPNQYGGREHLEAISFLRELNVLVHEKFSGVITVAEESTSWPAVSRPVYVGGLGFSMKWNMGWMNDNLSYIKLDPVYRKFHHNYLTFGLMYAFSENFVLPLSHDEVVHLKRSMLDKMPGDVWQKFANLRLFYLWQYTSPGKKLLFMGGEFGQWTEWSEKRELDWGLSAYPDHNGLQILIGDLNRLYQNEAALHQYDFHGQGFQWLDCNDVEHSTLTFMRRADDPKDSVIVVLNFTPVPREGFRVGVPLDAQYVEVLNSDSQYYAGSNCGNAGALQSEHHSCMGLDYSVVLTIPPLGGLILKAV